MTLENAAAYRNKPLLLAAATLGASLLPFCDYGGVSVSLFDIHGIVAQAQQAMSGLTNAGASLGDGSVSTDGLTGSLDILLLLYLVPASAAAVIYFELMGRPGRRWAKLSGAASITLPLLLPFIAWELFKAFLPDDIRSLMGSADAGSMGLTPGVGLWAIVLLGAVQTYLSFRRDTGFQVNLDA